MSRVTIGKFIKFDKIPKLLTININRMKLSNTGNYYKDNMPFEFPLYMDLYFLPFLNPEICNDIQLLSTLLEIITTPWLYYHVVGD